MNFLRRLMIGRWSTTTGAGALVGAVICLLVPPVAADESHVASSQGEGSRRVLIAIRSELRMTADEVRQRFADGIGRSDRISSPRVEVTPLDPRTFAMLRQAATGESDAEPPAGDGVRLEPLPGREHLWMLQLADPFDFLEEVILVDGRSEAGRVTLQPEPRSGSGAVRFFAPGTYVLDARELPSATAPTVCRVTVQTDAAGRQTVEVPWPPAECFFLAVLCEFRGPTDELAAAMGDPSGGTAAFQEVLVLEFVTLISGPLSTSDTPEPTTNQRLRDRAVSEEADEN